jgi:hypothetical protein
MLTTHPLLVPRLRKSMSYTSCRPKSASMELNGTTLPFRQSDVSLSEEVGLRIAIRVVTLIRQAGWNVEGSLRKCESGKPQGSTDQRVSCGSLTESLREDAGMRLMAVAFYTVTCRGIATVAVHSNSRCFR